LESPVVGVASENPDRGFPQVTGSSSTASFSKSTAAIQWCNMGQSSEGAMWGNESGGTRKKLINLIPYPSHKEEEESNQP
jgi:hypothetical protein